MSDDDKEKSYAETFYEKVQAGEPIMHVVVEPPVKAGTEDGMVYIDSHNFVAGGTNMAAVTRVYLTPSAAMGLRDYLNGLEFEVIGSGSKGGH
ncbi:hypothetical protein [Halopseudomonas aestusnigri]|uniref:Uncharacterized protein n=1 Tax=Halopseudomonas aestusnigri TaxID=857252 RepID=A0AAQ1GA81_9GAMM|nr:hypothetical protein [Halopseudomonas aestusnigri]SEG73464.1 hypothetical protein SAMN05216586_12026 [Halopseudomonas aestusnigri]